MKIDSLQLMNYRNYQSLSISFEKGTNVFYGDNAQGKTNILESIYLCGTTKSHRGSKDRDIIRFGEEEAHIRMMVEKDTILHKIDMHLRGNKAKGAAIDGIPIKKASELFGTVNMVFFSPEDLNIIKDGPSERRRFIDTELCQMNRYYMALLAKYNKILVQRNKLLKEISFSSYLLDTLDIWDTQLIECGKLIIKERKVFIEELNKIMKNIHFSITGGKEEIFLLYEPNTKEDEFAGKVKEKREIDLKMKTSQVGPHRDDLCVMVNGIDIRKFGSQGQQRSAALSLKLSEIYLLKKIVKDTPILLLDDVLSELDSKRQSYLLKSIQDIQTFITCTGMEDMMSHNFPVDKIYHVVDGTVHEEENDEC